MGTQDKLSTVPDTKLLKEELGERTSFYKEYNLGHLSFMIEKDMEYFEDVVSILKDHHN